jgi:hypothetical protein
MATLRFTDMQVIRSMYEHSRTAPGREHPYGIGAGEATPGLWLVKDAGIYLMSNGAPRQKVDGQTGLLICYAESFDPSKRDRREVQDDAQRVSSDDFIEKVLEGPFIERALAEGATEIRITIDADSVLLEVILPEP